MGCRSGPGSSLAAYEVRRRSYFAIKRSNPVSLASSGKYLSVYSKKQVTRSGCRTNPYSKANPRETRRNNFH